MGNCLFLLPHRPIKFPPKAFVHEMIFGLGIPDICAGLVPLGAPGDIPRQCDGLPLHAPPAGELFLLLPDAVSFQPVPEGHRTYDLFGQICKICLRIQSAEPLKPQQQPVLARKNSAHGKRMRILRAETMHDIRLHSIDDIFQDLFQTFIIFFGISNILQEAIIIKGRHPLLRYSSLTAGALRSLRHTLHGKGHGKNDAVSALVRQHCLAADPALLVGSLLPHMSGYHRQHHVAQPQYLHALLPAAAFRRPSFF